MPFFRHIIDVLKFCIPTHSCKLSAIGARPFIVVEHESNSISVVSVNELINSVSRESEKHFFSHTSVQ